MKKIYMDVSVLLRGTGYTGIPRVVMEVSKRLYSDAKTELVFIEYDERKKNYRILEGCNFIDFCKTKEVNRLKLRSGRSMEIGEIEKGSIFFDADGVWKSRLNRSFLYKVLKANGVHIIPLVHDIIGITHPQYCREDDIIPFIEYIGAVLLYAEKIVVTTQTTKSYMTTLYSEIYKEKPMAEKKSFAESIEVVPLGADYSDKSDNKDKKKKVSAKVEEVIKRGPYLLTVGTVEPRKNQELLIDAFESGLKDTGVNVVIAGYPGWNTEKLIERIESHSNAGEGIIYINDATDEDLKALYEHCFALAFPSHIEGYGLPIIEAFNFGAPVLLSDTPINHEVAGERALYFGEDAPTELNDIVSSLIMNPKQYNELKEASAGYKPRSWDETAKLLLEAFDI